MSQLEESTRDIFECLMDTGASELTEEDQLKLAKWSVLKAIVGEHSEKGLEVTPPRDRFKFRNTLEIPPYFAIYIGEHETVSKIGWLRHSLTLSSSADGPDPPLNGLQRNTQAISFLCGRLYILIIAIRVRDVVVENFVTLKKMKRLYPLMGCNLSWPMEEKLGLNDLRAISHLTEELKHMPNVRYGGDL